MKEATSAVGRLIIFVEKSLLCKLRGIDSIARAPSVCVGRDLPQVSRWRATGYPDQAGRCAQTSPTPVDAGRRDRQGGVCADL